MKVLLIVLLATIAATHATEDRAPTQWALLVAGSHGWWNYRHQADIAHAYKLLRERGFPASHIIVMMYDDVAHDSSNPIPGKLFNKPNGPDVYKGIKIDYKGQDVTAENFLAVLSGNKKAVKGKGTGRVIESDSHSHIFVNFADHGGAGILCFPSSDLNAKDLIQTLKKMQASKKFNKLVFYVEACEAGSNFDALLPEHTNILVSTASARDESSWGWYCDYKSYPCLGDLYSINWLEHLDKKIPSSENLFDQYQKIRTLTTKSHVQLYGDYGVGSSVTKQFIGPKNVADEEYNDIDSTNESGVSSRDAALHYYQRMAKNGRNDLEKTKYSETVSEILEKRRLIDNTVDLIIAKVSHNNNELKNHIENTHQSLTEDVLDSYIELYRHFSNKCFNLNKNQYLLRHFYKFVNICHLGANYQKEAIDEINSLCDEDFPVIENTL